MSRDGRKIPQIDEDTRETLERIASAIPRLDLDLLKPYPVGITGDFSAVAGACREAVRVFPLKMNPDCEGWVRLIEILVAAQDDPKIKVSRGPAEFLQKLSLIVGAVPINAAADVPLGRIYKDVESGEMVARAASSHSGRAKTRSFVESGFLNHAGSWSSISEAVGNLAAAAVEESKNYSRPLSSDNANSTIRTWLSQFVQNDPAAWAKLTPEAQKRIEKTRNRSR